MKKLLTLILSLCMAVSFAACGGGKTADQGGEAIPSPVPETPVAETPAPVSTPVPTEDLSPSITIETLFTERAHILPQGASVKSVVAAEGKLALLWTEDEQEKLGLVSYSLNEDGAPSLGQLQEINFTAPFDDCLSFTLSAPGDGSFCLLCGDSREGAVKNLAVLRFDSAGSLMDTMYIPDWDLQTVDCFAVDPSGIMLMAADKAARVYTWGQGLAAALQLEQRAQAAVLTNQGLAIVSPHEQLHTFVCNVLDTQSMTLYARDVYSFSGIDTSPNRSCLTNGAHMMQPCQGLHGELLVIYDGAICSLDLAAEVCETVLASNAKTGLYGKEQSCRLGDKAFFCIVDGEPVLIWQGMMEKRESGRLRVGVIEINAFGRIGRDLSFYTGANTPFTLDINTYGDDEAGLRQFQAELAGGAFDLVVFSGEISTGNNEFEDLYTYLDKDTELSREDFIPGFLDGLSTNGRLTELWRGVNIFSMAGSESLVGDGCNLTVADCQQIVRDNTSVQSILDNKLSNEGTLRYETLQNLAWMAACSFVDKSSATCSFDSQEFHDLLGLCGTLSANPNSTGNDFLLYTVQTSNAGKLDYLTERLGTCSYVGWPDGGDGIQYYALSFGSGNAMAIPANSQKKDMAWSFIKYLLSDEQQWEVATGSSDMPVIRSVVEEYNRLNFDEAQCSKFFSLLDRTHYVQTGADTTIRELIIETCQPYLYGDKSLDETVKLLQSRVSIYLAEQYG